MEEGGGGGVYLAHEELEQGGLPRSVGSHQGHPRVQVDTKLQVFINVWLRRRRREHRLHSATHQALQSSSTETEGHRWRDSQRDGQGERWKGTV